MTALEKYEPPKSSLELAPEAWGLAQRLSRTEFVPAAIRGKNEAVLACILTGHEVGISPMQALAKIHVVDGRPAMSAELMRAVVLREGHELWIEEQSSTRCILGGKRKGSERETRVTWTMDDAKRANLSGKQNWRTYPSAMLLARATAALCRAIFPDVLAGISYTVEELEDGDVLAGETGFDEEPTKATPAPTRTARARRTATRGTDAPAEVDAPPAPAPVAETPPLPGEPEADGDIEGPIDDALDDEIVDAEIVDEEDSPPLPDEEVYEGPDQDLPARSYSGPQIIAMRATELGIDTREEKLELVAAIIGREVSSAKDLTEEEIATVLRAFDVDGFDARALLAEEAASRAPAEEPAPRRRRAAPATEALPPEQWDGDRWRSFLADRKVKVSELLKAAARLAAEGEVVAPGTLDEIAGSSIAGALVGFVEDLSLERAEQ